MVFKENTATYIMVKDTFAGFFSSIKSNDDCKSLEKE